MVCCRPRTTWLSPTAVPEISQGWLAKIILGQAQNLCLIQVVDVDADVRHHLGGNVFAVLLDIGHPMVSGIRPAFAVP